MSPNCSISKKIKILIPTQFFQIQEFSGPIQNLGLGPCTCNTLPNAKDRMNTKCYIKTKFIRVASCSDGTGIMSLLLEVIICLFYEIHDEIKGIFFGYAIKHFKYFNKNIFIVQL